MNIGLSAPVPSGPHLSPKGKERIGEETTSQAIRSGLDSSSLVPTPCGLYGATWTAAQEVAAWERTAIEALCDIERDRLERALAQRLVREFARGCELIDGQVERMRARAIAEMGEA